MGTATFVLEDDGEAVAVKLAFSGGFDKTSRAHQAGQMLVKLMDEQFTNLGAPPEKPEQVIEQPGLIVVEGDGARRA
jgi:hypothetical protein